MEPTYIEGDEALYRLIRANSDEYRYVAGELRFASSAFNDRHHRPSVDRSAIRANPAEMKRQISDGVTKVLAAEVRSISNIEIEPKNPKKYAVDAIHRPIMAGQNGEGENLAHSQVECDPHIESGSRFKKLKEALALLASKHGFAVEPTNSE
jgi:hypothetical protein